MCDQHCNVCDKGFTETCRLLTCPAYSPAVEVRTLRTVSPVEALQRHLRDNDAKVFDQGRQVTIAEWSSVAEMVAKLDGADAETALLALPAPAPAERPSNVIRVDFKRKVRL